MPQTRWTEAPAGAAETVWAVAPQQARLAIEACLRGDRLWSDRAQQDDGAGAFERAGSIAILELRGPLAKAKPWRGTSTVDVRDRLRRALADDQVAGILLRISSPGGAFDGTKELADDVAAAAQWKPVWAYIEDLGASAAYWIASQADRIAANEPALIGSIGTYAVVWDWTGLFEDAGIKVHLLTTGRFKGAGVPGTEITDEQLAEWQRLVEEHNEFFLAAVRRGRNVSEQQLNRLADGRVWLAAEARRLGLIDEVGTYESVLTSFQRFVDSQSDRGGSTVSDERNEPRAATLNELKGACPGADSQLLLEWIERGLSVEKAREEFLAWQALRLEELQTDLQTARAERDEARAAAEKLRAELETLKATASPGTEALADGTPNSIAAGSGSVRDQWRELVRAKVAEGLPRFKAVQLVARENPELREALIAEANAN